MHIIFVVQLLIQNLTQSSQAPDNLTCEVTSNEGKRTQQNQQWFEQLFFELLNTHLRGNEDFKQLWAEQLAEVQKGMTTPQLASNIIIDKISFD